MKVFVGEEILGITEPPVGSLVLASEVPHHEITESRIPMAARRYITSNMHKGPWALSGTKGLEQWVTWEQLITSWPYIITVIISDYRAQDYHL